MSGITRREMVKMTALALNAPGLGVLNASGSGLAVPDAAAQPAADTYEWIHSNRTLIAEAYNPPFYPSLDYTPEKAVSIAVDLNCDSMRFPSASYYANFPTKSGYPIHPELKSDPMEKTVAPLRKAGLRTIAYVPLNHPFMAEGSQDAR